VTQGEQFSDCLCKFEVACSGQVLAGFKVALAWDCGFEVAGVDRSRVGLGGFKLACRGSRLGC
jgi:hypothetical protein